MERKKGSIHYFDSEFDPSAPSDRMNSETVVKHHYNYFYGEAVLNLNNVIRSERINQSWSLLLHTGVGYFYNHVYSRPNICANIGIQNTYQLTNQFQANLDISSIIGWDIYQGDEDILPGITFGVIYLFNFD